MQLSCQEEHSSTQNWPRSYFLTKSHDPAWTRGSGGGLKGEFLGGWTKNRGWRDLWGPETFSQDLQVDTGVR